MRCFPERNSPLLPSRKGIEGGAFFFVQVEEMFMMFCNHGLLAVSVLFLKRLILKRLMIVYIACVCYSETV